MKKKKAKPKKECSHNLKAIKVGDPMEYECTKCGLKVKSKKEVKKPHLFTLDSGAVSDAKNLIAAFKKIAINKDSKLNLSRLINNFLKSLNLKKLADYEN